MHFYTSITTNYIPRARILAKTLKKYNPDAVFHIVLSDDLPTNFDLESEPFDYIWFPEDFIEVEDFKQWVFKHTLIELCTAVKGPAALHILKQTNAEKLVYFDPDIAVFDNLNCIEKMLDEYSFLVIPHNCDLSDEGKKIIPHDISFLKNGVFNFGFFAVKNDNNGLQILNWWSERLLTFCFVDDKQGLFTDQKWGNLIPILFDSVKIIKEPNYDVATWNLTTRSFSGDLDNGFFVNNKPLKFYHFSSYNPKTYYANYCGFVWHENESILKLSNWYGEQLNLNEDNLFKPLQYKYAFYYNGMKIPESHRIIFRKYPSFSKIFSDPFNPFKINLYEALNIIIYKFNQKLNKFISKKIIATFADLNNKGALK